MKVQITVIRCDTHDFKNDINKAFFPYGIPNKEGERIVLGRLKEKYALNLDIKTILFFFEIKHRNR